MSTLGRRLTALEAIAEEMRLRPIRRMVDDLAREEGLSPAETEAAQREVIRVAKRIAAERDALLRDGATEREILERYARDRGVSMAELEAECRRISERYFG